MTIHGKRLTQPLAWALCLWLIGLTSVSLAAPPTPTDTRKPITSVAPDPMWTDLGSAAAAKSLPATNRPVLPLAYRLSQLDYAAMTDILAQAPSEKSRAARDGQEITLPMPDGTFQRFRVVETRIAGEQVQALVPDFRSYVAQGIDDPTAVLHLDTGHTGFHAYGRTAQGVLWIDPWQMNEGTHYISAWKHDFAVPADALDCGVADAGVGYEANVDKAVPLSGATLYTYRMAITLTGEYTTYFGGQTPAVNAAITTVNRINAIYEVDTAVRFLFTNVRVFDNPATDAFPSGATINGTNLGINQTVLDTDVGSANYDIGHLLTQGSGGGLAWLASVCTGNKARGGTGRVVPSGDPFDVDYVAHEVGHQMGGSHTFNGSTGSCGGGNRSSSNAFEPGSGTTIMAYAGICGAENVQANSDPYFHVRSLEQIISTRNASGCAVTFATGNTPPVANAGADRVIPRNTSFYLVGAVTDPDADTHTYSWEQYDLGAAGPTLDPFGPLFRSYNLGTNNYRYFGNSGTPFESLPTVDRSLTMRFIARDNRAGGGGVDDDEIELTVSGAPFAVTSPNGGESYVAGQPVTVTWDVGGSIASDIIIYLTHAGGFEPLIASTPNDGSEEVTLPCGITDANAKIWIQEVTGAATGVFVFDQSDAVFSLTDGLPDYGPFVVGGWGDSILPNSINAATLPTSLVGDTNSFVYWAYLNYGAAWGCETFENEVRLDEVALQLLDVPAGPAPNLGTAWGPAQPVISGGRHTLSISVDPNNIQAESDETNNAYARQWVWAPSFLGLQTTVVRSQPPERSAGAGFIPGGTTFYQNTDGLFLNNVGTAWQAVAVSALNGSDYDVSLFAAQTGVEAGFDSPLVSSTFGGPSADFVLINRNIVAAQSYDAGLLRYSGSGDYVADRRASGPGLMMDTQVLGAAVGTNQVIDVREIVIAPGEEGRNVIEVDNVSTGQDVQVLLFDATLGTGVRGNAVTSDIVDGAGSAVIDYDFITAGNYGLVVVRNAVDGLLPFTYDIGLRRTPPDIATAVLPGSHGPIVPQFNTTIGIGDPIPTPTFLEGDVLSTGMYFHVANNGPNDANLWDLNVNLDGAAITAIEWPFGLPGGTTAISSQALGSFNIPGGRHTAGIFFDSADEFDELDETNNRAAEQWVWNPVQIPMQGVVSRGAPPEPMGGWGDIPGGLTMDLNVDGLRTPIFGPVVDDGYVGGWAAAPNPGSDIDLRVHAASTGAQDGFEAMLETSSLAGNATEFVLFDMDGPIIAGTAFDIGAQRVSGTTGYQAHGTQSTWLPFNADGNSSQAFGPFNLMPGELLGVFEIQSNNGLNAEVPVQIRLDNLAGGADLALAVFDRSDASGFITLPEAMPGGYADNGGTGAGETVELTLPATQFFAIAVFKTNGAETGKTVDFSLQFTDLAVVPVPDATPLVAGINNYPNPFNPQTKLEFVLEKPGRATVRIYDVQGHLVRTVVDQDLAAGRHTRDWRGVDDDGGVVASGVYLALYEYPGGSARQRMVLLK